MSGLLDVGRRARKRSTCGARLPPRRRGGCADWEAYALVRYAAPGREGSGRSCTGGAGESMRPCPRNQWRWRRDALLERRRTDHPLLSRPRPLTYDVEEGKREER